MNNFYRSIRALMIVLSLAVCVVTASGQTSATSLKLSTVVLDPGHGGKDPGCVSKDRKTYEKNLTLSIAKTLGQKIKAAYPEVKVYYTRTTDKYLTLNERADIANRNNANLFISIHINSFDKSTSPNGFSAHILGQSSRKNTDLFSNQLDVCKRENSVIMLEEDYSTKYQGFDPNDPESFIFFNLMQSAYYGQSLQFAVEFDNAMKGGPLKTSRGISQDPFYVLWRTTMPAVLVETGFISNPADLKVLNSEWGRDQIAERLFRAFKEFKKKYDGSVEYSIDSSVPAEPTSKEEKKENTPSTPKSQSKYEGKYGIQVMASSRLLKPEDKAFKGFQARAVKDGNIYKYIIGSYDTKAQAQTFHNQVKRKFPDSFVVRIHDGLPVRAK